MWKCCTIQISSGSQETKALEPFSHSLERCLPVSVLCPLLCLGLDPGWACTHLAESMSVVLAFAFPKWGRKGAAV